MSTVKEFNESITQRGFWAVAGPAYIVVMLAISLVSFSGSPEQTIFRAYVKNKLAKEKTDDLEIQR